MGIKETAIDAGKEFLLAILDELKQEGKRLTPAQKRTAGAFAASFALTVAAKIAGQDMAQAMKYHKATGLDLLWISEARAEKAVKRAASRVFGSIGSTLISLAL